MKKKLNCIALIASFLVLTTSCSKDLIPSGTVEPNSGLKGLKTYTFKPTRSIFQVLGSTIGNNVIQLLINPSPNGVSHFITQNVGTFTASDPGLPIYYTAK
ncbi:hypothetical protein [Sphingobacterium sp. R2]|uniref:hypothetical protein n=1 Tax=Sphingobacterium sp. R2 TaxID=3112958 RepID=UPI00345DAE87